MASERNAPFYVMLPAPGSRHDTDFLPATPVHLGAAPQCPRCNRYVGMRRWLPPRTAEITWHGSALGDFAFFSKGDFVLSQRAKDVYEAAKLTGLTGISEITIVRVRPPLMRHPKYYYADVARSTAIRDIRSVNPPPDEEETCPECLNANLDEVDGVVLADGSWSGEDIFVARGLPGILLVTEAFRNAVQRATLTNVLFVEAAKYRWSSFDDEDAESA